MTIWTLAKRLAGWYLRIASGGTPFVGYSAILAWSMLYGSGVWLVCQQLHCELHLSLGVTVWAVRIVHIIVNARMRIAVVTRKLINSSTLMVRRVQQFS